MSPYSGCAHRYFTDEKRRKHYPVDCNQEGKKCERCGWNPDVEKKRIEKLRKMFTDARTNEERRKLLRLWRAGYDK